MNRVNESRFIMKRNTLIKLAAAAFGRRAGPLAGCREMAQTAGSDAFPPEDDSRSYRRFAAAQEAAGARHDGMLYAYHFDGEHLNSLGEHKLSMMLQANDHALPVVVYLNVPDDGH